MENILLQVNKPARYIGNEWNVSRKDFVSSAIKFALCFPDLYEIGMSNLGLRIIYGLLNDMDGVVCERFFAPGLDMEELIRDNNTALLSLESKKRLSDFDIVGFSIGSELSYTNILNILDLSGIPLLSASRGKEHPLVIGGGPVVLNPEPISDFFDLFLIGEAEECIAEILAVYQGQKEKLKSGKITREELLIKLSGIEGVYVPSLYIIHYDSLGNITEFVPKLKEVPAKIKKRFIKNLDRSFFPKEWLVPYIQIVHDRITLEVMRGCPNSCRFCQARVQYYPLRLRSRDNILDLAQRTYSNSGYEELSLCGLSVTDYPEVDKLTDCLVSLFKEEAVSVSLPSIKPKNISGNLSSAIALVKKTGLTFAPEAGTDRLRRVIGKDFPTDHFFNNLEESYRSGYQHVKLYFMIGLPSEENSDLEAIVDFSSQVSELRKRVSKSPAQVNISINNLIPKPHTPFQWLGMQGEEAILSKQEYIKKRIRNSRLRASFHDCQMSILEAVFSRGDRRLGEVILLSFKKGARFDAWGTHFLFSRWQDAFQECRLDMNFYLREKSKNDILPWDFIDTGINAVSLRNEADKINGCP